MEIIPKYVTLADLFDRKLFRIPDYQRAYSWEKKQRDEFFNDIRKIAGSVDKEHFMATVVGLRRSKTVINTERFDILDIVDGQQRLTTIIILLNAIFNALPERTTAEQKVKSALRDMLVKNDNASLLLLQTNHDSSHYFADYLRTGKRPKVRAANTLADRALLSAMAECELFVDEWVRTSRDLSALLTLLKNRLTLILHEIDDEAIVYSVFEVLNSRGLEVSWFDRLKSMVMGDVFESKVGNKAEHIGELHQVWKDVYKCVGLHQGMSTESLRFAATLWSPECPNRPLGEEESAHLLAKCARPNPARALSTASWIFNVTNAVDVLWADNRRNAVTRIAQARLLAVAMYLREDLADDLESLLSVWEKVTFRIYGMLGFDARTATGNYVRLAWQICNQKRDAKFIKEAIEDIGREQRFSIGAATEAIRRAQCYFGWTEELRYFLFRYEEYLSAKKGNMFSNEQWNRIWRVSAADSIEHIRPQSAGNHEYIHWLGNLLVLPPKMNSQLGAKPAKEKMDSYQQSGLLIANDVVRRFNKNGKKWTSQQISEREESMLRWAHKEWG